MIRRCSRSRTEGRYSANQNARTPANGVGTPVRSANVEGTIVNVACPYEPEKIITATVNRRVDLLELERSHGHISEAAYRTGREIQAVFEKASGSRGATWGDGGGGDLAWKKELAIIYGAMAAAKIVEVVGRMDRTLGHIDSRLVRSVIGDGMGFPEVAAARGRAGDRGRRYYQARFRDALEELATSWSARGKAPTMKPEPNYARRRKIELAAARQPIEGRTTALPGIAPASTAAITA